MVTGLMNEQKLRQLAQDIKVWGAELGFQQVAISDTDLKPYYDSYENWLGNGYHGAMHYMEENKALRFYPEKLLPGTLRIISVRMDYAKQIENSLEPMTRTQSAYIARYARGRDYHKLMRKRLQQLAERIQSVAGEFGYRAFSDSAPVLERAIAEKSGLGWIGKNTMLINKQAGSWFFLGELFTDIPLPVDEGVSDHCGSCRACLDVCPTQAFVGPRQMDATRCISYLTIELRTSIPLEFRKAMGNRVFGCDDCQIVCPWNKFTHLSEEQDFSARHGLDDSSLMELFQWSEEEFLDKTAGSPIRRIGYECWLRNLAIGLGNALSSTEIINALLSRREQASDMVREHIDWALEQHGVDVTP